MPTELAEALAGITPGGGVGLPCPALAAGCAEAYVCELSSELFPQLCRAAAGDRSPGCHATAHALCGPTRGQKCASFLGPVRPTGGFRRGMSRDIVHAQRGFRRRSCGDIVRRFTVGVPFPMDWDEVILRASGNEIRFAGKTSRRSLTTAMAWQAISSLRSD